MLATLTINVAAVAAGLSNDEAGSRIVPAVDAKLEENIALTCGHLTHVQCRRAHRAHSVG